MPDKDLQSGQRVQIVANHYKDETIEAFFTAVPLRHRIGTLVEQGVYDEDGWGQRWYVQTITGRLYMSEADVSPIPDLSPETTNRGFALRQFVDLYGSKCSIQDSSLATDAAIWLGVDEHFSRDGGGRMHLSCGMAAALIPLLEHFVEHGELPRGDGHGT